MKWLTGQFIRFDPFQGRPDLPPDEADQTVVCEFALLCLLLEDRHGRIPHPSVGQCLEKICKIYENQAFHNYIFTGSPMAFTGHLIVWLAVEESAGANPVPRQRIQDLIDSGWLNLAERSAARKMELRYFLDRGGFRHDLPDYDELIKIADFSFLTDGRRELDESDLYELTHAIFNITDYGAALPGIKNADWLANARTFLYDAVLPIIESHHWDLAAEVLMALSGLDKDKHPLTGELWQALSRAQNESGVILEEPNGVVVNLPEDQQPSHEQFLALYHRSLVTVLAGSLKGERMDDTFPISVEPCDFLMVVMPWAYLDRPSIGPSLLKSILAKKNISSQILYAGFELFRKCPPNLYKSLSDDMSYYEMSEHFFSCLVHDPASLLSEEFIQNIEAESIFRETMGEHFGDLLRRLRDEVVPEFIDDLAGSIIASGAKTIGFSCTFNQVAASLALAKKLKEMNPEIKTIFGGSSLDSEMGLAYHEKYPHLIDHVFLGEADDAIADIVLNTDNPDELYRIPGLTSYRAGAVFYRDPFVRTKDLDQLPAPDYDDFFLQYQAYVQEGAELPPHGPLPFESSRGCWWACSQACSFCGLNGERRDYRAKSPDKVVHELEALSSRYARLDFAACDNIIDKSYYTDFFPQLAEKGFDYSLWYETRTTLTQKEVQTMALAGVKLVQAGVESFSDHVLKLMKKGVTGLQNIQFIKWCQEAGIKISYFILCGFPGELPEDYQKMAAMFPSLTHLCPPHRMQLIDIHRFSPMFENPAAFGVDELFLRENALHVYPENLLDGRLLYSFRYYSSQTEHVYEYTAGLRQALAVWQKRYYQSEKPPKLEMQIGGDFALIQDSRAEQPQKYYLNDIQKAILLAGNKICSFQKLYRILAEAFPHTDREAIDEEVNILADAGLIITEANKMLSLPIRPAGLRYCLNQ